MPPLRLLLLWEFKAQIRSLESSKRSKWKETKKKKNIIGSSRWILPPTRQWPSSFSAWSSFSVAWRLSSLLSYSRRKATDSSKSSLVSREGWLFKFTDPLNVNSVSWQSFSFLYPNFRWSYSPSLKVLEFLLIWTFYLVIL